jgi:hypothetical protein
MGVFDELLKTSLIDVGEVRIARATTRFGGVEGKERYVVYLPFARNYLWRVLHDTGEKVRVYVEIPERLKAKLSKG